MSPLGPTVTDQPTAADEWFGSGSAVSLSNEQKRAALYSAEHTIDRRLNDGLPLPDPIPPDVRDAANLYATYLLLLPNAHPATALGGEDVASTDDRLELAREYKILFEERVEELDKDPNVGEDDEADEVGTAGRPGLFTVGGRSTRRY